MLMDQENVTMVAHLRRTRVGKLVDSVARGEIVAGGIHHLGSWFVGGFVGGFVASFVP